MPAPGRDCFPGRTTRCPRIDNMHFVAKQNLSKIYTMPLSPATYFHSTGHSDFSSQPSLRPPPNPPFSLPPHHYPLSLRYEKNAPMARTPTRSRRRHKQTRAPYDRQLSPSPLALGPTLGFRCIDPPRDIPEFLHDKLNRRRRRKAHDEALGRYGRSHATSKAEELKEGTGDGGRMGAPISILI